MGVIIRTVGEGQRARYFVRDLRFLLEQWAKVEESIKNDSRRRPACSRSPIWSSAPCAIS